MKELMNELKPVTFLSRIKNEGVLIVINIISIIFKLKMIWDKMLTTDHFKEFCNIVPDAKVSKRNYLFLNIKAPYEVYVKYLPRVILGDPSHELREYVDPIYEECDQFEKKVCGILLHDIPRDKYDNPETLNKLFDHFMNYNNFPKPGDIISTVHSNIEFTLAYGLERLKSDEEDKSFSLLFTISIRCSKDGLPFKFDNLMCENLDSTVSDENPTKEFKNNILMPKYKYKLYMEELKKARKEYKTLKRTLFRDL
ncbi:MAG: hypothetical protein ACRC5M_04990 [Anaeroplasmataceae bacterium]